MPSRRSVLSTAGAIVSGGCVGLLNGQRCFEVWTADEDPVDYYAEQIDSYRGELETVVENAPEPVTTDSRFEIDGVFRVGDGYYRLARADSVTEARTELEVEIRWAVEPSAETVVDLEELPAVDREVLEPQLSGIDDTEQEERVESVGLTYSGGPETSDFADSSFSEENELWVEYEERIYSIEIMDRHEQTVERWRHEAEIVAESQDELQAYLDSEYLISLDDVTEDEQSILDEAIDDGYNRCGDTDEDLKAEEQRLSSRLSEEMILPGYRRYWHVSIESERYLLRYATSTREP